MVVTKSNVRHLNGERPHVLFLNRSFWPDTEATGQLLTELTVDLTAWFDVTVIAGTPNHVDQAAEDRHATMDEYRGVRIHRAWHSRFSKHSSLGRLVNLSTFAAAAWLAARGLKRPPDVIVVETDPFFLPLVGHRLQRRYPRSSLVCYLQDLYPDIAVVVGKIREGMVTRTLRKLLFDVYRRADRVIVLSRDMQQRCESLGVSPSSLEVVSNWTDTNEVWPIKANNEFRRRHGLEDRFVVMYSGNMGLAHDLDSLLETAVILRDRSEIEWVFIGDGVRRQSLEARVAKLGLKQVRFLPYQPKHFLAESLSAADVHLVSVLSGATACVMPSKLYGILASGTPTLAVVEPATELSDLINEHQIGFACSPGDAESLAERIRQLSDDPELGRRLGQNARRLAEGEFRRERQTARFGELLFRVLGKDTPASLIERLHPRIERDDLAELEAVADHVSPVDTKLREEV